MMHEDIDVPSSMPVELSFDKSLSLPELRSLLLDGKIILPRDWFLADCHGSHGALRFVQFDRKTFAVDMTIQLTELMVPELSIRNRPYVGTHFAPNIITSADELRLLIAEFDRKWKLCSGGRTNSNTSKCGIVCCPDMDIAEKTPKRCELFLDKCARCDSCLEASRETFMLHRQMITQKTESLENVKDTTTKRLRASDSGTVN